ncbi:MAG: DUF2358 domain-containing protein [Cyanobacteria bacterium P01_A01_bin.105]
MNVNATIIDRIRTDYEHFPRNQSYELYDQNVAFKDPLNQFSGVDRYRWMIGLLERLFTDHRIDLHEITHPQPNRVTTRWTLSMTAKLPWQPQLSIPGHSDLMLNEQGLIVSHIDDWSCSRWDVLKQVWQPR